MKPELNSIESYLSEVYDFKYNTVNNKLYYKEKYEYDYIELKDYDLNTILRQLKSEGYSKVNKKELGEILNSSFTPCYNPFKEYFESLPVWDGTTDYIQALADTVQVEPSAKKNWETWLKKWIVGVVATVMDPAAVNHQALVFTGPQGIGKTSWLKNLTPPALSEYYYGGTINLGNKDTEIQLSENMIINLDELDNLSKKNMSALKEIITKPSIKLRRPYGSVAEKMKRHASFVASVNNSEFLVDKTGNRRFLTIGVIDINFNHGINMDDVYAQALMLYESDFQFWMDLSDIREIEAHNQQFIQVPIEQEVLEKHFKPCTGGQIPDLEFETEDLIAYLYEHSKLASRISAHKLGSVLNSLNWPKRKTKGRRYWLLMNA